MPIVNRFAALHDEIADWRHDLHENPELNYEVHRTAGLVADRLRAFGVDEVATGIGRTGVVGLIRGRNGGAGKVVGLRADMDALPIIEATGKDYASKVPGLMHACGHDGHTSMLLGAAKYLAETRNFEGTVAVIFQPAEEDGAGGEAMVKDGLMERFGIEEVYGMHNQPGMPLGTFAICPGSMLASADRVSITIQGKGGHASKPHQCVDPLLVGAHIVTALQGIVARNVSPLESAVVSITVFKAGEVDNVIPHTAFLMGTVRTLDPDLQNRIEARIREIVEMTAKAHGATAEVDYVRDYPVTVNDHDKAMLAADAAACVAGENAVDRALTPTLGSEDFSFMLNARPGAMIFIGNGDSQGLHHPEYDFNDEAIPFGCSYWVTLAERALRS